MPCVGRSVLKSPDWNSPKCMLRCDEKSRAGSAALVHPIHHHPTGGLL
jgi:hypothetical protein